MGDISIHNYPDFAGPRPRKKGQQPPKITTNPSKERHAKGAIDLEAELEWHSKGGKKHRKVASREAELLEGRDEGGI
jgi:hypothetical protein